MIRIDNAITRILCDNNIYILAYLDFEKDLKEDFIIKYVESIIEIYPLLKKEIVKEGNNIYFKEMNNFKIENHIKIENIEKEKFNEKINIILNTSLEGRAFLLVCYKDKIRDECRVYFLVNHGYIDGYKLINALITPLYKDYKIPKMKRETGMISKLYYYVIGTIILLVMNIRILINLLLKEDEKDIVRKVDNIICKPLKIEKIKKITKKKGITINDFLYSLMIRTDELYMKEERILNIMSPMNIPKNDINNICPIIVTINNKLDNEKLLEEVNNVINKYKYSLYIKLLSYILNNTKYEIINKLIENISKKIDYIFTNVVGPPYNEIENISNLKLKNMRFLLNPKHKEIVYNIISFNNKINIVCSFNEGIIKDKKRFEKCIYKAYKSLLKL